MLDGPFIDLDRPPQRHSYLPRYTLVGSRDGMLKWVPGKASVANVQLTTHDYKFG